MRFIVFGFLLLVVTASGVHAGMNRLQLAAQCDWGGNRGFVLQLENDSTNPAPCQLTTMKLVLCVADGTRWRYLVATAGWEMGKDYHARAVVGPHGSELWLDGELAVKDNGPFVPATGDLAANLMPSWAAAPLAYRTQTGSVEVRVGKRKAAFSFKEEAARPPQIMVFDPQSPKQAAWGTAGGETVTVEADFTITRALNPRDYAPLIDRYGQVRHGDWPGKIRADGDFERARVAEDIRLKALGDPAGFDRYGGFIQSDWHEKPTGFYRAVEKNGFWWLVTPDGNPCFYVGLCHAPALTWETSPITGREELFEAFPPRDGLTAKAWGKNNWGVNDGTEYVAFHTWNLIRKYGEPWMAETERMTARRLRAWGFSGAGKFSSLDAAPCMPVLNTWNVPKLVRHADIFDPEVKAKFRDALREQIEPRKDSSFIVGWSVGNEYDEIITRAEIREILKKPAEVPAKKALIDYALDKLYAGDAARMAAAWKATAKAREELYSADSQPPSSDIEKLRCFYADRYYDFVYTAVRRIDPNHLYFGFWIIPGWWESEEDWRLIARHCDVVGYDLYANDFADERLTRLVKESDKPVFCGEFSFPPSYGGMRGYGKFRVSAEDEQGAAKGFQRWVEAGARNPYCVGVNWWEYRDQPVTGRGPGHGPEVAYDEHFAFGLIDVADNPKWGLIEPMRKVNLTATKRRLEAMTR